MSEPVSSVVAANVAATITTGVGVVIFGVHTGLDFVTLVIGLLGGGLALSYRKKANLLMRAIEVLSAALIAGWTAPVCALVLVAWLGKLPYIGVELPVTPVQFMLSLIIGYLAHGVILPGLRKLGEFWTKKYSQ